MYKVFGFPFSSWLHFFFPLKLFAGVHVKPSNLDKIALERLSGDRPIVFVMARFQLLDLWVLNIVLKRWGVALVKREARSNGFLHSAFLAIRPQSWPFYGSSRKEPFSQYLEDILLNDVRVKDVGICLLPVSVFWSRGANRSERNFILRSLFPDDGNANLLQKLLLFVTHRGNVDIHFGNAHVLKHDQLNTSDGAENLGADQPSEGIQNSHSEMSALDRAKRYRRVLLAELNRERTATLGPALYEFSTVANWILGDSETQKMIADSGHVLRTQRKAYHYLKEIAANYNYTTIRAFEAIFDFVWTKIFKGVRVRNFESVREVARTGRILWMPCHRSHLDYMLLSYVLFKSGLACPHIAAGVNLSFWPAGPLLRRGGAFYIRRSFSGNKLYARVFSGYVDFLMHNGYPIEFFHEGGRSRIGKLMTPRFGVTSICVRSILRRKAAATYVVPVFIGYDKVMEDDSYAREVSGAKKHKESAWQLLRSVRYLFSNYGRVDVSFGAPIHFGDFWKEYVHKHESMGRVFRPQGGPPMAQKKQKSEIDDDSDMQPRPDLTTNLEELDDDIDSRLPIVQSFVESLAFRVNEGINAAGVASGTSLLAIVFLALGESKVDVDRLKARFEHAAWIVDRVGLTLGWKVSNSFSALEGSFSLATGEFYSKPVQKKDEKQGEKLIDPLTRELQEQEKEVTDPIDSQSELLKDVVRKPLENQEAQSAFHETIDACLKWNFLIEEASEASANSRAVLGRSEAKSLNWYWYRGTVFHIFAVPGIAAKIIQKFRDKKVTSVEYKTMLAGFDAIRKVWKLELFWPRELESSLILDSALHILEALGVVTLSGTAVEISHEDVFKDDLDFVSGFVAPEKEIYGLQLASALQLMESKGGFRRDDLINHAFALHRSAFLRGLVTQPPSLTRVYGQRSYEALLNMGVYVSRSGNLMRVSYEALQPLVEFFDISELNEVQL